MWSCARSGYPENAEVHVTSVESEKSTVRPGENDVSVQVTVENRSKQDVQVLDVILRFESQGGDARDDFRPELVETCPCLVPARGSSTLQLEVDVSDQAAPGTVTIDANVQVSLPNDNVVMIPGAASTGSWEVLAPAQVGIVRVVAEADTVTLGETGLRVSLELENLGSLDAEVASARLLFRTGDTDASWDYRVTFDASNPVGVPGGSGVTLGADVDVSLGAAKGTVEIDAEVQVLTEGGTPAVIRGASETDSWEVVGSLEDLVVSVADDEDDTGGFPSLETAGGAADLSLREALLIANSLNQPVTIRFDEGVFPSGQNVFIELTDELGALPSLNNAGTRIDGSGTGEALRSAPSDPEINGLRIRADDVTIQGFNISGFFRSALSIYHVDRAQVVSSYIGWSGDSTGNMEIYGGEGHVISGCTITGARGNGIILRESPIRITIADNEITAGSSDGIEATGYQVEITGNLIQGNEYAGIHSAGVTQGLIRDNQIIANGRNSWGDHGIFIEYDNAIILIENNQLIGNFGSAIRIGYEVIDRITISACYFEGNESVPISMTSGANSEVQPPVIDSFDGVNLSGTAGSVGGLVEVYSVDSATSTYTYLGRAEVTDGSWGLELAESAASVAATFTLENGSTSAFCPSVQ